MRKFIGSLVLCLGLVASGLAQNVVTKTDLSIFPKPEKGYKQVVIEVPHSKLDNNKKIEFKVGKVTEVDGCNYFGLMGTLEEKDLQGWGYNYYVFTTDGQMTSTQMGCLDSPNRHLFVSAAPQLVNYNGRLPIVIYVPEEYEVRFKIYETDGDEYQASEVMQKRIN